MAMEKDYTQLLIELLIQKVSYLEKENHRLQLGIPLGSTDKDELLSNNEKLASEVALWREMCKIKDEQIEQLKQKVEDPLRDELVCQLKTELSIVKDNNACLRSKNANLNTDLSLREVMRVYAMAKGVVFPSKEKMEQYITSTQNSTVSDQLIDFVDTSEEEEEIGVYDKKIPYSNNTKCPLRFKNNAGETIYVGTEACSQCKFFKSHNALAKYVICKIG